LLELQFEAIQGKQVEIKRFRISFYLISMQVFFIFVFVYKQGNDERTRAKT